MQCATCKNEMEKKNEHQAGNIRFQRWTCSECRTEQNEALGIVGGMPD